MTAARYLAELKQLIEACTFRFDDERGLHDALEDLLSAEPHSQTAMMADSGCIVFRHPTIVEREAQLPQAPGQLQLTSRIDLLITGEPEVLVLGEPPTSFTVGIEVKTGGSFPAVYEQLRRYSESGALDALLLVSSSRGLNPFKDRLGSIPFTFAFARRAI